MSESRLEQSNLSSNHHHRYSASDIAQRYLSMNTSIDMSTTPFAPVGSRSQPSLSNQDVIHSQSLPHPRPHSTANCDDYWSYRNGIILERKANCERKRDATLHRCPATPRLTSTSVMAGPSTPLSRTSPSPSPCNVSTSFAADFTSPGASFDISLVSDHSTNASDNSSYLDFSSTHSSLPDTPSRPPNKSSTGLIGLGLSGMGESSGFWRGTGFLDTSGPSSTSSSTLSRQFLDDIYYTVAHQEELSAKGEENHVDIADVNNSFEDALSHLHTGLMRTRSTSLRVQAVTSTPTFKRRLSLSPRTDTSPLSPTISSTLKRSGKSPKAKSKSSQAWRV